MLSAEQIIKTICKELADSPSLSVYLQMAEESLDSRFFGKLYQMALAYKACHLFTVYGEDSSLSGIAGAGVSPISGVREGGLSVNFHGSGGSGSDTSLSTTKYGKMLLDLMKTRPSADVNRNNVIILPYIV